MTPVNCINKKRMRDVIKNPCSACPKRWKGCPRKHELVDSSILLNAYLDKKDTEKWLTFLNSNGIKYTGFISVIQVGHIIRKFAERFRELNLKKYDNREIRISQLQADFETCMKTIIKFHILDFDSNAETRYKDLEKEKENLWMESHDLMNVAIAIANKLYIQVVDRDLENDFPTIKKISEDFGWKIKINEKYN